MNEVIALQPILLQQWLEEGKQIQLLDVREQDEWDICHIAGSLHIPMNDILKHLDTINPNTPTVVICHHGVRSGIVADRLSIKGYGQLYNLTGGIDMWARQVDKEMARY
ncbi:MAG: hypothetical protein J0I41_18585 [Filimonas sp.]|nr:hypothetical protein [Filimonas sp.]